MVILTLHTAPEAPLDAQPIAPAPLAGLSDAAIARLPLRHGNQLVALGDFFRVQGSGAERIVLEGDLRFLHSLGAALAAGQIEVQGDAGPHIGAAMRGGEVVVRGSVGACAGAELAGGRVVIHGDAGPGLGAAYPGSRLGMRGGEIVVLGSAGENAGNAMRRGLIAIGGDCDPYAGVNMRAGTIVVFGVLGHFAGMHMRRGTIVAMQPPSLLPGFVAAGTFEPLFLRLYLRRLQALGLPVAAEHMTGRYRRYSGDMLDLGRGEMLVLEEELVSHERRNS